MVDVSIPFRAVAGFFEDLKNSSLASLELVSIPFRAVAGFFDKTPLRVTLATSGFNPFQGCRWVLCSLGEVGRERLMGFNPFQGCRWVLCAPGNLAVFADPIVSIPFRAVAGFFAK